MSNPIQNGLPNINKREYEQMSNQCRTKAAERIRIKIKK